MKIVRFAVRRPVTVSMVALAAAVFGLVSLGRLDVSLLPEIRYPTLTVQTELEGSAPVDVENLITRPLEEAVGVVPGLRHVHSVSQAGLSQITLEFDWGTGMDYAGLDVREKIDMVRLPDEAAPPVLLKYDPALDPVLRVGLWGEQSLARVRAVAEDVLKTEIEAVQGVAAARVSGGLEEEVQVLVDEGRLASLGLTIAQVEQTLARQNVNASGGRLRDRGAEYIVRTLRRFEDLDDLRDVTVGEVGGRAVRLDEVAEVIRSHKERTDITHVDGRESVEIAVFKEGDANVVETARRVREALARLDERLPSDLQQDILFDQSVYISAAVDEVRSNAILGGLLAVGVLFVFLRDLRSTLVIGLAIPLSIVATFILMLTRGVSLNVMSLGGLALGVGMLVDNSIVVLEAIQRRRDRAGPGADLREVAAAGAAEVAGAVTASTLTTLAVFVPIVFVVVGVAGQVFRDQALTVTFALAVSLVVSLTFTPMAAAVGTGGTRSSQSWRQRWRPTRRHRWWWRRALAEAGHFLGLGLPLIVLALVRGLGWLLQKVLLVLFWVPSWLHGKLWPRIESGYAHLLAGALRARPLVLLVVALVGVGAWWLGRGLGAELVPPLAQGSVTLQLELPEGTPLDRTDRVCADLERQLTEVPGVVRLAAEVGTSRDAGGGAVRRKENRAEVHVQLASTAPEVEAAVLTAARRLAGQEADLRLEVRRPALLNLSAPVQVEVYGHDLEALQRGSDAVAAALRELPDLRDVRPVMVPGSPEIRIALDRDKLGVLGLDQDVVASTVRAKVGGVVPGRFRDGERHLDIRVRGQADQRATLTAVNDLVVAERDGKTISLGSVATLTEARGPAEIHRVGGRRAALISADLGGRDLATVSAVISDRLREVRLPAGVTANLGGQNREMSRSFRSLQMAVLLAVFLVYLVMASQFESVVYPLIIMITVPLALAGAVYGLVLVGRPLSVFAVIGAIMLAGIVVNNGIVLVDRMNQLRRAGRPLRGRRPRGRQRAVASHPDDHRDHRPGPAAHGAGPGRGSRATGAPGRHRDRRPHPRHGPHPGRRAGALHPDERRLPPRARTRRRRCAAPGGHPVHCGGPLVGLTRLALRRPVTLLMILVTVLVLGAVSVARLKLDFLPRVDFPFIAVFIPYENGLPEENERTIVRPIEEVLATMGGVHAINSYSDADQVQIGVQFDWDRDVNLLRLEIQEKLDQIRGDLPQDIRQILLLTFDSNDIPIIEGRIAATGRDLSASWDLLEQHVIAPLQRIPGVGRVNIDGVAPTQCSVYLRFDRILEYGVDVSALFRRLQAASFELTVGRVTDRGLRYDLRAVSDLHSVEDLEELPVDSRGLRLKDVAEVVYGVPGLTYGRRLNGEPAIAFWIQKGSGANTVEVCRAIEAELERINADPALEGIHSFAFFNQADEITDSLRGLLQAGAIGSLLALVILLLFLRRLSLTLVTTAAIPLSLLGACIFLYLTGRTLNILSMMGLMLGVGMLVDNAVVVLESIHRHLHAGRRPLMAVMRGTREVGTAVVASTLTTIIVFAPVVVSGDDEIAIWLSEVGVTISVTLLGSLLVSLTVMPMLAARVAGQAPPPEPSWLPALRRGYERVLRWTALRHPLLVTLVILPLLMAGTVGLMKATNLTSDMFGDEGMRRESFYIGFEFADGVDYRLTDRYVERAEAYLESRRDDLRVRDIYAFYGTDNAGVTLFFEDGVLNDQFLKDLRADLRENLPVQAGQTYRFGREDGNESGARTFAVTIYGRETEVLRDLAATVRHRLEAIEGVEDMTSEVDDGTPEIRVHVMPEEATRFGVEPASVAEVLGLTYRGVPLPRLQAAGREIDVIVSLLPDDRESLENLALLTVGVKDAQPVQLGQVATFEFGGGPQRIFRRDQRSGLTLRGSSEAENFDQLLGQVRRAMDELDLPLGYGWSFGEDIQRSQQQQSQMGMNMLLALACVFFVMAGLFESITLPLVVMACVPFASLGVFWTLMATGTPMNLMAMIGIVILIGIVVNNGIVLVDHINHLRRSGRPLDAALREGCADRLRPILMTAGTTILGLLPLALLKGTHLSGMEYYPMARAICGGLAVGTGLTLLVLPAYYWLTIRWVTRVRGFGRGAMPVRPASLAVATGDAES